jgi:spore coat polysaccharide biosynthesis predicted glycosyltransferase SpsG
MLRLGIRVSTIFSKGKGHFTRCLAIRRKLQGNFYWFIDNTDKVIEKEIPGEDKIYYENSPKQLEILNNFISNNTINSVLIDSYNINISDIEKIAKIPSVIIIDEDIKIKANMIICSQPIELNQIDGVQYLSGPKYAPISGKYFYEKKKSNNKIILVSFGAVDSYGVTLKAIQAIKNIILKYNYEYKVIITLGKYSPIIKYVKLAINDITNFKLIIDSFNMKDIYNKSTISIGAPGLSYLERMASGLPSLLVAQNVKHIKLINSWANLRCCIKANNNVSSIEYNLKRLLINKGLRRDIINNGVNLIDGEGSSRIAKHIDKLIKNND